MVSLGASMYLRDLNGDEYMVEGAVKYTSEINGDERIDVDIEYTHVNSHFLNKHSDLKMWIFIFETKEYRIISSTKKGFGNNYTISITGILYMLDWLNSNRIYQRIDASLTSVEAMNLVFDNSPFTYQITAQSSSLRFEGLGDGETRLEMLKKFIERYGFEITTLGNTMYFQSKIGNDTNFQYEYKVNATDITQETDAAELFTYAEGYGDYPDDDESAITKAKLKRSYVSPLENIIGHRRHAPPIKDGRITNPDTMDAALKKLVDNSLQVSFSANLNDLKHRGYKYEHAKLGDRIFLVDKRIGLDIELRVVKIDRTYTQEYNLKDITLTFGNKNMADTYTGKFSSTVSNFNDVMAGRKAIPFEALGVITQSMVTKIQSTSSELSFDINGIHAIDKNNANNIVTLNSSGMYLSTDGGRTGKTAITAEGITASAITTGEMLANRIRGGTLEAINGYSSWNMNTGSMYFFGDSLVRFYSMYNQIVQSTQSDSYSAGMSFETQDAPDGMLAYFGTSAGATLNPRRNEYAGLTVRSDNRTSLITGDKIMFSQGRITKTEYAPTWHIDGISTTSESHQYFYGTNAINGAVHNYYLGKSSNPFKGLYVVGIGEPNAAVNYAYFDKLYSNTLNKFELKEFGGSPTLMFGTTGIQFAGADGIYVINAAGQRIATIWAP